MLTLYHLLFLRFVIKNITIMGNVSNVMFGKAKNASEKLKELSFDNRVEGYDEIYDAEYENRTRQFEYKTECVPAMMEGNMTGLDIVLNHETSDGWQLVDRIDAQEFGRGVKPGVIFVFERPVKESDED